MLKVTVLFASPVAVTLMRLAGAGAGFLAQLLLARLLGAADLGLFYAVTSLAAVAGLLVAQGYPAVATRFVARYGAVPPILLAFARVAVRRAVVGTVIASAALVALALVYPFDGPRMRIAVILGAILVPFATLFHLAASFAGAFRRFDLCYIPEALARPLLFLAAVAGVAALGAPPADALLMIAVFVAITAGLALLQGALVGRHIGRVTGGARSTVPRPRLARRWRAEASAAILIALLVNGFADLAIVLVSPMLTAAEVAVFGLCLKLSVLVGFFVQVAHHMVSPDLAQAFRARDAALLQRSLRKAVYLPTIVMLATTGLAALWGDRMLNLFGPEFSAGAPLLVVLLAAQAVRAVAGPSVTMLTLIGAQRQNAILCLAAVVALAVACMALVPFFAGIGAASAVLLAMAVWYGGAALVLRKTAGLRMDLIALASSDAGARAAHHLSSVPFSSIPTRKLGETHGDSHFSARL